MKTEILILSSLVIIHTVVGLGSVGAMITYSLGDNYPIFDILAFFSIISFLIFRRCIAIDIYDLFKEGIPDSEIPDYARDNYFRKMIHSYSDSESIDFTHLRLDILDNIKGISDCHLFFNRKAQYIIFNTVLVMILSTKYSFKFLLPLFLSWVLIVFPA
jgi:hypothetical protein